MPKLTENIHPLAVCPRLTINDLCIFRDLCEGIHVKKESISRIAKRIGVTRRKCELVLEAVAKALLGDEATAAQLQIPRDNSPGYSFYQGLSGLLEPLTALHVDCTKARQNRLVVQGSDFCILWFLPAVFAECGLPKAETALEIRRGSFQRYMANLRSGRTDVAIGPKAPVLADIATIPLLTVPRVLIYPTGHSFACGKSPPEITLRDLERETVFYLSSEAVPEVKMTTYFPDPRPPGRRIAVDSVSHIYLYVDHGLGVSLGYAPAFVPAEYHPRVCSQPLVEVDALRATPAQFFLYYPTNRQLSGAAREFIDSICRWVTHKTGNLVSFPLEP